MNFRGWCLHHFPGGRFSGDSYSCKNVFRGEKNESFSITESVQKWHDFGTGEGGKIKYFCRDHNIEPWDGAERWEESRERKDSPSSDTNPNEPDARAMWEGSVPVETHPYLDKKVLSGEGLRITTKEWRHSDGKTTRKGTLLIPARDIDGTLHGVERILPDGKLHLGRKARCFFGDAPEPGKPFFLAEGYATACAIRRLSGWPAAEIFGFACLENAAKVVTERYPEIEVVLCPDRVNEETQRTVVARMKEKWTVLELPDERPKNHDWDDEVRQYGLEATKETFRERWNLAKAVRPNVTEPSPKKSRFTFTTISAAELSKKELPAVRWAVPGVLAEGLTVLGGPPKLGKSIFALHVGQAVASGGMALSSVEVEQGSVLYLALEDTAKRIQDRLVSSGCAPEKLEFPRDAEGRLLRDVPKVGEGLEEALQEWIGRTPDARMIIIDTFQKVRPRKGRGTDAYEEDYRCISALKALADKNGVAILLVHHTRKGTAGEPEKDFLESLLGSQAIAGSADSVLVMTRARGDNAMTLSLTGRDIEERTLALTVDFDHMTYRLEGDAEKVALSEAQKKILAVLNASKTPVSREDIREYTGMNPNTLKSALFRLGKARIIRVIQDGEYRRCFEVIQENPREGNLSSRGDSDNGCVSASLHLLHPANLCTLAPTCEPDAAMQTDSNACTRDEASNTNGSEDIGCKGAKGVIIDPNRCTSGSGGASSRETKLTPAEERLARLALKTFMIAAEKVGTLDKDGAFVGLHRDDWRPFFLEQHTGANIGVKNNAFDKARGLLADCGELSAKNDYYRPSGALADLEKSIVEKLRESGSHKSQEDHGAVTSDAHVDVAPAEEGEKEPVILLSRGSLEDLALRSKVPSDLIRESMKPLLESGRIVLSGNDIYENPTRPNAEDPSEAIEDDEPDEEDAASSGPEKGEEGPADSSSRGDSDNGGVSVPDVSPACTREETSDAPSEDLHPAPCIEPEKEEPVFLSRGEETPAEAEVQDPEDSSPRGENPVFLPRNGEVVFPDPLPLPFMWPGKGWIVEVKTLGDGSRSFGLSPSKSGKARSWLREPKGGKV